MLNSTGYTQQLIGRKFMLVLLWLFIKYSSDEQAIMQVFFPAVNSGLAFNFTDFLHRVLY